MSAFKDGVSPDFGLVAPTTWIRVIDQLLLSGQVAPARHALHHLREREPDLDWPGSVLELVDLLPEHAGKPLPFKDDQDKDVQVVERLGASCVVFAFCGRRRRINMPLWLFNRWMSAVDDVSVVYLRDFSEAHFVGGIRSLGSRAETVAALRGVASDLGARRTFCLGNSSGGYAAMRYGLDLGAERVANFGGSVNLEPSFNTYLNRTGAAEALKRDYPGETLDLRELYVAAAAPPCLILVHGEQCWDDRLHHEHMIGAAGAILLPLSGYAGHGPLPEMIRRGGFARLLDVLVGTDEGAVSALPALGRLCEPDAGRPARGGDLLR